MNFHDGLIRAIDTSNLYKVKEILSDPSFKYNFISTVIHAYRTGKFDIFKYLVSISNMDDYRDDKGKNILLTFVVQPANPEKSIRCLSLILNNTKNIDSVDDYGNTALFYATISYARSKELYMEFSEICYDMLIELLKYGSNPNIIGGNGNSAYMIAIDYDDIDLLKILRNNSIYGIDDNVMLRAIIDNKYDFVEYLLTYLENIDKYLYIARTCKVINPDIIELLEMNND